MVLQASTEEGSMGGEEKVVQEAGHPGWDKSSQVLEPVAGKVLAVAEHAIHFTFSHEGNEETAVLTPGRSYISGSANLLSQAPTRSLLRKVFSEGSSLTIQVKKLEWHQELVFCTSGEDTVAVDPVTSNDGEQRRAKNAETSVPKKVSYGVVVAWVGAPPDLSLLNNPGNGFESFDQGFKLLLESVYNGLFQSEGGGKVATLDNTHNPATATPSLAKAKVIEVTKPSGGAVEVDGRRLPFSRAVVHDAQGRGTGHTTVLEETVQLGQEVQVELVEDQVAALFTGIQQSRPPAHPDLPQGTHHHKVRVVELLGDEGGRQHQGLATIQSSQLVRSGGAAASMVGECATFCASDLYFFGVRLTNTDLGMVMAPGDEVYCQLDMLEVKEGRAQYRVKVGWIQRGPTGASAHGGPGWKWPGQLQPESAALHRHLLKLGLAFKSVEEILVGKAPLQCSSAPPNYEVGTICELEPAENNETVSRGLIKLTAGPRKGSVIKFTRAKSFLFGVCLEKADLLYLVRPQEQVCCEVSGLADYKEGEYA